MTVYLLHFERPISDNHTAQHYLGYSKNPGRRLAEHKTGHHGAKLTNVANERGIGYEIVRTWEGGAEVEAKLKAWKNGKRLCPVCNP